MTEKLELYDILGVIVPGALLVYLMATCFRAPAGLGSAAGFPEAFLVIALTALTIFAGQLMQALGSSLEPFLHWTWGGKPSSRALVRGLGERYLPADATGRIRRKLEAAVGPDESPTSLFLSARARAEGAPGSLASRFNALYAYHRGLLVLAGVAMITLIAAMQWGGLSPWSREVKAVVLAADGVLLLLLWYRAKQRAFYYVGEVLLAAERILDDRTGSSSVALTTPGE
jgi:hypothetical protein